MLKITAAFIGIALLACTNFALAETVKKYKLSDDDGNAYTVCLGDDWAKIDSQLASETIRIDNEKAPNELKQILKSHYHVSTTPIDMRDFEIVDEEDCP